MAARTARPAKHGQAATGTWAWIKEYTGYLVTVLPYVSSGLILIPALNIWIKAGILLFFVCLVLYLRVWHERAALEETSPEQKRKKA